MKLQHYEMALKLRGRATVKSFRLWAVAILIMGPWPMPCAIGAGEEHHEGHIWAPGDYVLAVNADISLTGVAKADRPAVHLQGATASGSILLNLPAVPAKPATRYRCTYRVNAAAGSPAPSLYMMIREHPASGGRPFTPYHKTSVRQRQLPDDSRGIWIERSLEFSSRDDCGQVSIGIAISAPTIDLYVSEFRITDIAVQSAAEYAEVMTEVREKAARRRRLVPRTLVFSRSQMKYGLERNYYRAWLDRPLFVNRAYRVGRRFVTPFPSYKRILEEVANYGIDGLAFFPETKDRMGMFELTDRANIAGIQLLPEFIPTDLIEPKSKLLTHALACKSTIRIGGKVLITSYNSGALTPGQWHALLTTLRERHGNTFIFLPALSDTVRLMGDFRKGNPISRRAIEERQQVLRNYLDVCDGIYFHYPAAFKKEDRTFDTAFYRDLFIPVFKSVLAEEPYRNKYLGLSAYHSHSNSDLSIGLLEDNTRTLRHSFEAAVDAEPDVIVLPEWDEQNENTSFRPTICNSRTSERLLRYYMSGIHGTAPSPLPGDDTSVPNLILSYRKMVTLGEELTFELLHVPDSREGDAYSVELRLADQNGRNVRHFGPVTFSGSELQEHRFEVPTETLNSCVFLVPSLKVSGYRGTNLEYREGFHHVQLRATWNWDYKYVKQPLRDLLQPITASFGWSNRERGAVKGRIEATEKLALVEVLEDDDVVFAVDPRKEFSRSDPGKELLLLEYRSLRQQQMRGTLILKGAHAKWLLNGVPLHQPKPLRKLKGDMLVLDTPVSPHVRWVYLAIPKDETSSAEIILDSNLCHFSTPVADVLRKGILSRGFADGLTITIMSYRKQIDMPHHIDDNSASFDVAVFPEIATSQIHMRATTVSGKTFRTHPLLHAPTGDGSRSELRIFSQQDVAATDVSVDRMRIPDVRYVFDRSRGDILWTAAGRPFWGSLGGYTDTTTGRGGNGGGSSAIPFSAGSSGTYPDNAVKSAPEWCVEDERTCLKFDGLGNFISLPRGALPRRGAFTMEFTIKPIHVDGMQYLFVHRSHRPATLAVGLRGGVLFAQYYGVGHQMNVFDTNLVLDAGEWSTIRIRHDFQNMQLSVNGRNEVFPCNVEGFNIGPSAFGGYGGVEAPEEEAASIGNPGWFRGFLSSLRILHNAVPLHE